jgi:TonB family protein
MIASWMLYATLVGVLATLAAVVLEHAGLALGRQIRFVWVAVILTTMAWPLVAGSRPVMTATTPVAVAVVPDSVFAFQAAPAAAPSVWRDVVTAFERISVLLDTPLLILWGVASALLFLRLAASVRAVRRGPRSWRPRTVDGVSVLVSEDVGPAVIGLRDLRIVLPRWTLDLDPSARVAVLRHEDEHRRARDPYLLVGGAILTILMPWNLAIWWQCRRLRLAIEIDCDARVLRQNADVEEYGSVLLSIASRRDHWTAGTNQRHAPVIVAALIESMSNLERRITAMTSRRPRYPRAIAAALFGTAMALALIASYAPVPPAFAVGSQTSQGPKIYTEGEVDIVARPLRALFPEYPAQMRSANVEGAVTAQFVVGTDGRVDPRSITIVRSSHDLFAATVRSHLAASSFRAAQLKGARVPQRMQVPFTFALSPTPDARRALPARIQRQDSVQDTSVRASTTIEPPTDPVTVADSVEAIRAIEYDRAMREIQASGGAYFEYQVEQAVRPNPRNTAPNYPSELRKANVEGQVLAQFVVGSDGAPVMATFKVLKSAHDLFTLAVHDHLPAMRFIPALVGGHPVAQIVQMPFLFTLSR